jgi:hypothetical protein
LTVDEDTTGNITLMAIDLDGDPLAFAVTSQPINGVLGGTAPNLTYTPAENFSGTDSFSFAVTDGDPACMASGTVSITVNAVNDCPVAIATVLAPAVEGPYGTNYTVISLNNTNAVVSFDGSLSWDVEGDGLTYLWTEVAPPDGSIVPIPPGGKQFSQSGLGGSDEWWQAWRLHWWSHYWEWYYGPGGPGTAGGPGPGDPTVPHTHPDEEAGPCEHGPITELSLRYEGNTAVVVSILDDLGDTLFEDTVAPGEIFTFNGLYENGRLGEEVSVVLGNDINAGFNTSGRKAIGPGLQDGLFMVVGGLSWTGEELCVLAPPPVNDPIDFGNSATASRELHLGMHNILLTVSDGDCSGTEMVLVEVITVGEAVQDCINLVDYHEGITRDTKRPIIDGMKMALNKFNSGDFIGGVDALDAVLAKVEREWIRGNMSEAVRDEISGCIEAFLVLVE